MTKPLALAAIFMIAVATASTAALADGPADVIFKEGRELAARGDWDAACARFAEAHRLNAAAAGPLLNLGDCEERRGHLGAALTNFREGVARLAADDDRRNIAAARIAVLERRLAHLVVRAPDPPTSRVFLDGAELNASSWNASLAIDPGEHVVTVRAPGRAEQQLRVALADGESRQIAPTAGPPESQARSQPPPADVAAPATGAPPTRTAGIIFSGVAVASLATAIVTGVLVEVRKGTVAANCNEGPRTCNPDGLEAASSGKTLLLANTIAWVSTIASAGIGVTLLVLSTEKKHPAALVVRPATLGGGLAIRGTY